MKNNFGRPKLTENGKMGLLGLIIFVLLVITAICNGCGLLPKGEEEQPRMSADKSLVMAMKPYIEKDYPVLRALIERLIAEGKLSPEEGAVTLSRMDDYEVDMAELLLDLRDVEGVGDLLASLIELASGRNPILSMLISGGAGDQAMTARLMAMERISQANNVRIAKIGEDIAALRRQIATSNSSSAGEALDDDLDDAELLRRYEELEEVLERRGVVEIEDPGDKEPKKRRAEQELRIPTNKGMMIEFARRILGQKELVERHRTVRELEQVSILLRDELIAAFPDVFVLSWPGRADLRPDIVTVIDGEVGLRYKWNYDFFISWEKNLGEFNTILDHLWWDEHSENVKIRW